MSRSSAAEKAKKNKPQPIDMFEATVKQVDKGSIVNNADIATKSHDYKRQTYYLTDELIQAVAIGAGFEKKDKSEFIRDILTKELAIYIDLAAKINR